ncbi:MAG: hypothetical protein JW894_12005 [Bacteroidales bacterium]|nr:hypothetical protein [Bacteroidales bacterium]
MRSICIPVKGISEGDIAEVEVRVLKSDLVWKYRLESFKLPNTGKSPSDTIKRIDSLRKLIKEYDQSWELIQILDTIEASEYVHILYRKKTKND